MSDEYDWYSEHYPRKENHLARNVIMALVGAALLGIGVKEIYGKKSKPPPTPSPTVPITQTMSLERDYGIVSIKKSTPSPITTPTPSSTPYPPSTPTEIPISVPTPTSHPTPTEVVPTSTPESCRDMGMKSVETVKRLDPEDLPPFYKIGKEDGTPEICYFEKSLPEKDLIPIRVYDEKYEPDAFNICVAAAHVYVSYNRLTGADERLSCLSDDEKRKWVEKHYNGEIFALEREILLQLLEDGQINETGEKGEGGGGEGEKERREVVDLVTQMFNREKEGGVSPTYIEVHRNGPRVRGQKIITIYMMSEEEDINK